MSSTTTLGVLAFLLLFFGGCCALTFNGCGPDYADGSRAGTVTKLSRKGLIWKSWEGELLVGGMRARADGKGIEPNILEFNAADQKVLDGLRAALESGERVELVYRQWALAPWTISNDHVILEVKR